MKKYIFATSLKLRVLLFTSLLLLVINNVFAQNGDVICPGNIGKNEGGVWVVYDGKDQYKLSESRRIPAGASVSLRGYPFPEVTPRVTIRDPESGATHVLEVLPVSACDSWITMVPAIPPNSKTEIIISDYKVIGEEDKLRLQETLYNMLLLFSEAAAEDVLTQRSSAFRRSQEIESLLVEEFPPESTLSDIVVIENRAATQKTAGARLIEAVTASRLEVRNLLSTYVDGLETLNDLINLERDSSSLSSEDAEIIRSYLALVPEGLLDDRNSGEFRNNLLPELINGQMFPPPQKLRDAINAFADIVESASSGEEEEDQISDAEVIRRLGLPLEERLPHLFSELRRIQATSYTPSLLPFSFSSADLLRYGNVDFVEGYVFGLKEPRSMLMFTFFPFEPQERTPTSDMKSVAALSIGYSVAGGDEGAPNLFLGGITFRMNRYFSFTAGGVIPESGGGPVRGFVGFAADLTAIPFLDDLFAVKNY